jgi:hypothetical protein
VKDVKAYQFYVRVFAFRNVLLLHKQSMHAAVNGNRCAENTCMRIHDDLIQAILVSFEARSSLEKREVTTALFRLWFKTLKTWILCPCEYDIGSMDVSQGGVTMTHYRKILLVLQNSLSFIIALLSMPNWFMEVAGCVSHYQSSTVALLTRIFETLL